MNVLLVEDDADIGSMLSRGLKVEGFDVTTVERADQALDTARDINPCAVVLDMILPDGSGLDVCRALRETGYTGPILFVSAKDEVQDRVDGLTAGADDYIVKPFQFDELVARLRTHLLHRSGTSDEHERLIVGRLVLDHETRQAHYGTVHVRLTQREAELLALLMQNANHPVSRGEIFDRLWATQGGVSLNVVDVYVGYLRTKFADITRVGGPLIGTVRGRGFMLDMAGNRSGR
ncbi:MULTISPECIES: response regulator transcription factor [Labrys]|jgi:DNA-binding response OmpR family regulator|uniref:response regulator transcription factor n=1 Tax=Labrys TaxID=204476 RepID=UPI00082B1A65|nr:MULTISPECIES: response regulator transcription factor [unclassified Labrys (in: a-proteobacteria)]MDZ5452295.1 response regulator transcription factor [Labrys sp. ZIDIC5]OCC03909.1 DNA-binding response regulator [Labrys sp. WJW]